MHVLKMLCARSLWSGWSCMARVTSSSSVLVGMWRVWWRPAHKALHPWHCPASPADREPATDGEATQAAGVESFSLLLLFFQLYTCCGSADPEVRTFNFSMLWYFVSVTSFTSTKRRTIQFNMKAAFFYSTWSITWEFLVFTLISLYFWNFTNYSNYDEWKCVGSKVFIAKLLICAVS